MFLKYLNISRKKKEKKDSSQFRIGGKESSVLGRPRTISLSTRFLVMNS